MYRLLSSFVLAASAQAVEFQNVVHSTRECIEGKTHSLKYVANMSSSSIVDLDGDLGSHLDAVTCDIDHTTLQLHFKHDATAVEWLAKFHDWNDHFIVGGDQWNCSTLAPTAKRPEFILRRIVGASESINDLKTMSVQTDIAQYSEVFESADISYGVTQGCDTATPTASKHICLGYNTKDCDGTATAPIPLYSTTTKNGASLTATCTDCWASLSTDVFVDISIKGFKLQSLSGGFKNAMLNTSMVVQADATGNWNTAIDKTLPLIATAYLLNFKVGAVPFMLFFDVPMEVQGSLSFDGSASLTLGGAAAITLSDAYVTWTPTAGWTHTKPFAAFSFTPALKTKDQADVQGSLTLVPSFNMHFDRIFSYSLKAQGALNVDVALDGLSICEKSTYDLEVVSNTELHININLINFHRDWTWGPTTMGSWTGHPVKDFCVRV